MVPIFLYLRFFHLKVVIFNGWSSQFVLECIQKNAFWNSSTEFLNELSPVLWFLPFAQATYLETQFQYRLAHRIKKGFNSRQNKTELFQFVLFHSRLYHIPLKQSVSFSVSDLTPILPWGFLTGCSWLIDKSSVLNPINTTKKTNRTLPLTSILSLLKPYF